MDKILIVDDEADIRRAFRRNLETESVRIVEAGDSTEAVRQVAAEQPDLVVMDIRMAGVTGLETLKKLRSLNPKLVIIMMTAYGTTQTAIEAMKLGAYDYLLKPLDVPKLKALIAGALQAAHAMKAVVSYPPLLAKEESAEGIVGRSDAMQQVFKMIGQVSHSDATVLITGESGTGKELVARAIYHHSQRMGQPFMAINCAAIPENLLESELFGHEKGAFTGASDKRIGKFEQCDKGTLFLDEIGDMPASTQTKILRLLQNGEFQRVGGNETLRADVRVIAATNKDPQQRLREDLYYRLNVVRIHLPALRERAEDVPVLVEYFLQKTGKSIAPATVEFLKKQPWPGNVRELENVIERAVVMARGQTLGVADLPAATPVAPAEVHAGLDPAVKALLELARRDPTVKLLPLMERELIVRALEETEFNQVRAAKLLGITRATLRKRIENFKIERRLDVQ